MTNIRRYWEPGQTCFLTHVTHRREPLLADHGDLLLRALRSRAVQWDCEVVAWVVLPDHCHLLLNAGDAQMSSLMRSVKLSFATNLRKELGRRGGRVWQNRFWDRIMRDEDEMNQHIDYIHYNPVKHGYVRDPFVWPHSSLGQFHRRGVYQRDWGVVAPLTFEGEYGE